MKCNSCQGEVQNGFKFCPYCGAEVNKISSCHSCNNQVKPEWVSCPFCGSALKGQVKPQNILRNGFNPQQQPSPEYGYKGHYEHGHHHGSGSSSRRGHKRGFLGRIFS